MRGFWRAASALCLLTQSVKAVNMTLSDINSVRDAAGTIAYGLMKYYTGNNTGDVAGNLPAPYFWWEAGSMFMTMIQYWKLTGDETYNNVTMQALQHQVGPNADFMPPNQTRTEGNDDQGFWALAAMTAAENNFPNPPSDQPQWLALAQAVFNEYVSRWDPTTCNGGMRWQIFTFNNGYTYKNSISNGCFFNLGSRLARFTGNQTYADWAAKIFEWEQGVSFIDSDWRIWDGAGVADNTNCTQISEMAWSYNAGIYIYGAATMYNVTDGNSTWKDRLDGLLNETTSLFFKNGILFEQACELQSQCDTDELSFKGYMAGWLSYTTLMAPYTYNTIMPLLQSTATAAAQACIGSPATGFNGLAGTACGFQWTTGTFDDNVGVGQQMNALSAVIHTLTNQVDAVPVTSSTGGTSQGNPDAGQQTPSVLTFSTITTGDRFAAGLLTTLMLLGVVGGGFFVVKE